MNRIGTIITGTATDGRKVVVSNNKSYHIEVRAGDQTVDTDDTTLPNATRKRLMFAVHDAIGEYEYELSEKSVVLNMWTKRGMIWLLFTQWLCMYSILLACLTSLAPFVLIFIICCRKHTCYDEKNSMDKIVVAFDNLYIYVIRNRNKVNKEKHRKEHLKYYIDKVPRFCKDSDKDSDLDDE